MPITPLSVTPNSITSPSTFNADMDTHLSELPTMISEFNAELAANTSTGVDAAAAAVLAAAEAVNAHNEAAASAALAAGAVIWVTGLTYAVGDVRYSPLTYLVYRRIIAGAGSTDPSLDSTNWVVLVDSAIPTTVVVTATGTWTCPAHIRKAKVTVVGGGASSTTCSTRTGLGGSGGGTAIKTLAVTPGTVYTCTIGAGGVAPTGANTNNNSGGTSSFSGTGISTVSATGGSAALYTETWTSAGMGSGGDINIPGGATLCDISSGTRPALGGGTFLAPPTRFGQDATGYGAGGGGSLENSSQGYAGKAGVIVIEY